MSALMLAWAVRLSLVADNRLSESKISGELLANHRVEENGSCTGNCTLIGFYCCFVVRPKDENLVEEVEVGEIWLWNVDTDHVTSPWISSATTSEQHPVFPRTWHQKNTKSDHPKSTCLLILFNVAPVFALFNDYVLSSPLLEADYRVMASPILLI